MDRYKVEITAEAEQDFIAIKEYIIGQFADYGATHSIERQISDKIMGLAAAPFAGAIVEIDGLNINNLRSISVKKYRIFYYVDEITGTVIITRILYGRRDFTKIFEE